MCPARLVNVYVSDQDLHQAMGCRGHGGCRGLYWQLLYWEHEFHPALHPPPEWGRPPPLHTRAKLSAFLASPSDNTSADSSAQFDNRSGTDRSPGASPAVTPGAAASRVDAVPSQLVSQAVLGSTMTAEAEAGF